MYFSGIVAPSGDLPTGRNISISSNLQGGIRYAIVSVMGWLQGLLHCTANMYGNRRSVR